jgi:predicted metal-dependent hydrolase
MKAAEPGTMIIDGRKIEYRVVHSKAAGKLRVRVGPGGVEIVQPDGRNAGELGAFVCSNADWIVRQLERIERLRRVRRPERSQAGEILYRGQPTPVRVESYPHRRGANRVVHEDGSLVIVRGNSPTAAAQSLENWLRKRARAAIEQHLGEVTSRLNRQPARVYVMGQRTKWGNCSATQNLSFNWRLILAPPFVLRYLVTHEAVHLAVPDHSSRFWLTVQSLCPEMDRAKQWLSACGHRLRVDLAQACRSAMASP